MESLQAQCIALDPDNGHFTAVKSARQKPISMTPTELKEIIGQLGVTQEQLARAMEVSTSAVAKWCQGKARISGPVALLLRKMAAEHRRKNGGKKATG